MESIQANIGQAYGIRLDLGAVVSMLVNVDKVKSTLSLRHLEEFFLFQQIWISSIQVRVPQMQQQQQPQPIQSQQPQRLSLQGNDYP